MKDTGASSSEDRAFVADAIEPVPVSPVPASIPCAVPHRSFWLPIETAPKDGSLVVLTAFEDDGEQFEVHPMVWAHIQRNGLFPGRVGMWTAPGGAYTWNDDGVGGGPTHWLQPEVWEAVTASLAQAIEARRAETGSCGH